MNIFCKLVFFIITAVIASTPAKTAEVSDKLKIIFRYDDYSKYTSMEVADSLIKAARDVGSGVLVGVIPFPYGEYPESYAPGSELQPFLSQEKIALLKKHLAAGTIEIAVHGFGHRNNVPEGRNSEFSGLPENKQILLLQTAKEALETATGVKIRAFVPPFNQYDATTLKALEKTGYQILSAGMGSYSDTDSRLDFLPGTTYINRLREVVSSALAQKHSDATVVVTLHPYDIIESGDEFPKFRKGPGQVSLKSIIDDLNQVSKIDNVQLSTIGTLVENGEDLSIERWQANLRLRQSVITRHLVIPGSLRLYPLPGLYYPKDAADRMYSKQLWSAVTLYGGLIITLFFITRSLIRLVTHRYKNIAAATEIVSLSGLAGISTLYFLSGFHISFVAAVAGCLGILMGALSTRLLHAN